MGVMGVGEGRGKRKLGDWGRQGDFLWVGLRGLGWEFWFLIYG